MMKLKPILFGVLPILTTLLTSPDVHSQKNSIIDSISLYGSVCTQVAVYKSEAEIQNNGSKIGFGIYKTVNSDLHFFADVEMAVNLVDNNYTFNSSINTTESLPDAVFSDIDNAVSTRLGYIGFSYKNWGTISIGKQWGAYYDVSGWTDMFDVFGGQASGTYLTGTDGGELGTGRAAKSVIYRNNFGPLKIGLQAQLNGIKTNYGGSLIYNIAKHLELGIAVNNARITREVMDLVIHAEKNEVTGIVGIKFSNEKIYTAFNFNHNGGNVVPIKVNDSILLYGYNYNGYEWFFKYCLNNKLSFHGGLNVQTSLENDNYIPKDFHLEYYVIGGDYQITPTILSYFEMKIDRSINAIGHHNFDVYTIGLKIDLGLHKKFSDPGP